MNFDLHLYGETPEELLNVLAHLGHMDSNYHTPIPDERHPAQAPAPQPQSEPVTQPDKPKAQTPSKAKKPTREPAAVTAEERVSPTNAPAQNAGAAVTTDVPAAGLPEKGSEPQTTPAGATAPAPDPATLDKIRDLARSLIVAGKRAGVQAAIKATGAASVSKLPSDSYTSVWEELLKLKDEVDANASN